MNDQDQAPLNLYALVQIIGQHWPRQDESPSDELVAIVNQALDDHPDIAMLWMLKAQMLQLFDDQHYDCDQILACFEKAVEIDPDYTEAHVAIGEFCEELLEDLPRAQSAYETAITLEAGPWAHAGLARVLAKQGKIDQALAHVDPANCLYHDEPEVQAVREEIQSGVYDN